MRPADQVLQRLRTLCAALPETSETSSWGHPNFRAGNKTFATFELIEGRPSIAFRLDGPDLHLLLRRKHFFPTPYGRSQWASVWADAPLDWRFVADLLERSYRQVALQRMITALGTQLLSPASQPCPAFRLKALRNKRQARLSKLRGAEVHRPASKCQSMFP
jgi:predicted DNA-binding protein (MmcQ/YjbR family)